MDTERIFFPTQSEPNAVAVLAAVEHLCRQAEWRLTRIIENDSQQSPDHMRYHQNQDDCDPGMVELEARVGIIGPTGRFEAGINPQLHEQFYRKMPKDPKCPWFKSHDIEETHDYFYTNKDNVHIRDTVHYSKDGIHVIHISKQNLAKVDIEVPGANCDIRVALSTEEPVDNGSLPDKVEPYLVRIKRRHLFEYVSREMKQSTFNFVFTWSWSGKSREEAERNQRQHPFDPTCEFEIECIHPMRYRQFHGQQHKFVAESLLRKVLGFLSTGNVPFVTPIQTENYYLPMLKLRQIMDIDSNGNVIPVWKSNNNNNNNKNINSTKSPISNSNSNSKNNGTLRQNKRRKIGLNGDD